MKYIFVLVSLLIISITATPASSEDVWGSQRVYAFKQIETPSGTSTVSLPVSHDMVLQVFNWTTSQNQTVDISGTFPAGKKIMVIVENDAVLSRVITFGSGFKSTGVVTGIVSRQSVLQFVSDGTHFVELSRTLGIPL
jgi:hypothetical protein